LNIFRGRGAVENPAPHRTAVLKCFPRGAFKKKSEVPTYLPTFFGDFLRFSGRILENIFVVFLGSSCRETAKKGKRRQETGKKGVFSQLFRPKVFDMDFPQKKIVVFLNSPC
jgi:hypothetical protein